jgi:hypothetical protein
LKKGITFLDGIPFMHQNRLDNTHRPAENLVLILAFQDPGGIHTLYNIGSLGGGGFHFLPTAIEHKK